MRWKKKEAAAPSGEARVRGGERESERGWMSLEAKWAE